MSPKLHTIDPPVSSERPERSDEELDTESELTTPALDPPQFPEYIFGLHEAGGEYLMIDARDLKGGLRRKHQAKLEAGKLALLGEVRKIQLFRVVD